MYSLCNIREELQLHSPELGKGHTEQLRWDFKAAGSIFRSSKALQLLSPNIHFSGIQAANSFKYWLCPTSASYAEPTLPLRITWGHNETKTKDKPAPAPAWHSSATLWVQTSGLLMSCHIGFLQQQSRSIWLLSSLYDPWELVELGAPGVGAQQVPCFHNDRRDYSRDGSIRISASLVTGHLQKKNSMGKCPRWGRKGSALPCIEAIKW